MNPTRFTIKIRTTGVSIEELPRIMEQVRDSFINGYVNGSASNDGDREGYNFETKEV